MHLLFFFIYIYNFFCIVVAEIVCDLKHIFSDTELRDANIRSISLGYTKMSVSVFNPVRLTEFHRMKFPEVKMHHAARATPSLDRVRRDLFGPVDREECSR